MQPATRQLHDQSRDSAESRRDPVRKVAQSEVLALVSRTVEHWFVPAIVLQNDANEPVTVTWMYEP